MEIRTGRRCESVKQGVRTITWREGDWRGRIGNRFNRLGHSHAGASVSIRRTDNKDSQGEICVK